MPLEPLHKQIADDLRRQISTGALAVGESLPSEAQLCSATGVSRGPVRQALAALRAEGLIGGPAGKPPVVRRADAPQPFESLLSFSSWAESIGRRPGQRTLELALRPAAAEVADQLGLHEGDKVVQLTRLRTLDGRPAMVERTTFVEPVGRLLFEFDIDDGSIFAALRDRGVDLSAATHLIDAVAADAQDAELLGVGEGSPLLRERRRTAGSTGIAVEWSDDRYLPELVSFTINNAHQAVFGLARTEAA